MTEERCTGACCIDLVIPMSPDELARGYRRWLQKSNGEALIDMGLETNPPDAGPIWTDIHLIFPMLRYLGFYPPEPSKAVNPEHVSDRPGHHYACKHFDAETRNCTIYEDRPDMCRGYPYRSTCDYAACTWLEKKTKRISEKEQERFRQMKNPIVDPNPDGIPRHDRLRVLDEEIGYAKSETR